ncbi:MAG: 1-deoxy-D-xylulose-5-phosphate synthase [Phycisphaerae bacterium]|nr:1-deoxy-D-xylulose-5-phosphate synthase [Phycisphaerae bacterium]
MSSILSTISHPSQLRTMSVPQLEQLAKEIRERILDVVGREGGHLASNLGVVELSIALHYCFDFEADRLLWDVGHQCYPHKLLTGRNKEFDRLRQTGGISGFPSIHESAFDVFDVGHAGTAVSTAIGLAHGEQRMNRDTRVVAVVGDASIVNGLSFEGLNQASGLDRQLLVILNDNNWGIVPTQGGMAEYLAKFRTSSLYEEVKRRTKQLLPQVPVIGQPMIDALGHIKDGVKATLSQPQIFEQLGFRYCGPMQGHDIAHLIEMLTLLRDVKQPVLLHVHTEKGRGAEFAEAEPGRFHSPNPFVVENGVATIPNGSGRGWTAAFSDALVTVAKDDPNVVAITAGMPDGTGLDQFAKAYPDQFLDLGIAESCAVDVAAGMAKSGLKPIVAIYSTFMQRAFDQIFQEVSLQGLPVVFCMDRAGLVGGDGAVHHGFLDINFLRGLPEMTLLAPADENELVAALRFAMAQPRACAIRYPRANVPTSFGDAPPFVRGEARLMRDGTDATILAYGSSVAPAMDAAELLANQDISVRVYNARFARPVDVDMVRAALAVGTNSSTIGVSSQTAGVNSLHPVITVEEHSVTGGFGSAVLEAAQELGLPTHSIIRLGMPADRYIKHGSRRGQLAECGIDEAGIAAAVMEAIAGATGEAFHRQRGGYSQSLTSGRNMTSDVGLIVGDNGSSGTPAPLRRISEAQEVSGN